ncbi:YkgJ family cysteine cluster protein [Natroniella acetigena]|uniref:YkgJ family cysteine cluster protein n=1 Tax=Natroniella acetigena TaxID=52004 RepID=UPI002009ED8A|nr:YkgJ family cysteine cluster protein [Natroniella acetigena]MCK8828088.1 YkgJ family cysteine cluster protein [Natroniella acetigena]
MTQKFSCKKCGSCCRTISDIEELEEYDLGDGSCKYLKNNICLIYNERPEVCRVDKIYLKYFKENMKLKDYHKKISQLCSRIKNMNNK